MGRAFGLIDWRVIEVVDTSFVTYAICSVRHTLISRSLMNWMFDVLSNLQTP